MTDKPLPTPTKKERLGMVQEILEKQESVSKKLPNFMSLGSERAVLSLLLTSPDRFHQIKNQVQAEDFASPANKRMFEIINTVSEIKNNGNYVTPDQILYEQNFTEEIKGLGGNEYLNTLVSKPYPSEHSDKVVSIIRTKKIQRDKYSETCTSLQRILDYEGHNVEDIINIGLEAHFSSVRKNSDLIGGTYRYGSKLRERLEYRAANPTIVKGYSFSWFKKFTNITDGAINRELFVIGARPKSGKSTLLNQLAVNLAIIGEDLSKPGENVIPAAYVDSEMEDYQQEDRACAMISSVEEKKISKGLFATNAEDAERVWAATSLMESKSKLFWDRLPLFDTMSVVNTFKMRILIDGCKVGFFDQIKDTMDAAVGNSEKEHQRIGWLVLHLKHLCEDEDIPIIAAMQLGRGGNMVRKEKRSPDSIFADSDRVLRFASKCAYMTRMDNDEIEKRGGITKCGDTVINLFANRSGESHPEEGGIGMLFRKRYTRFEEVETLEV